MKDISIVIGAARSGTTLLKNFIGSHSDFAPTDLELNHLWRYGNSSLKHDFFKPELHLRSNIIEYIQESLRKEKLQSGKCRLIEKTVSNVARVSFVANVLPNSKFIHIIRDGRAVSASAIKRWQFKPSSTYLLKRSTLVPVKDIPRVALNYSISNLKKFFRKRNYRQSWGPRWESIDEDVKNLSLARICSRQWKLCVESAMEQGSCLGSERYLEIRYEELLMHPKKIALQVAEFLNMDPSDIEFNRFYQKNLSTESLHKWKDDLSADELNEIEEESGSLLNKLGYVSL